MKLYKNRGGTGSVTYTISISGKEAVRAGLVDENGDSYELEKVVDVTSGYLVVRRSYIGKNTIYVDRIIRDYKDILLSGSPALDNKGVLYWIDGDTLYERIADNNSTKKAIAKKEGDRFLPVE